MQIFNLVFTCTGSIVVSMSKHTGKLFCGYLLIGALSQLINQRFICAFCKTFTGCEVHEKLFVAPGDGE